MAAELANTRITQIKKLPYFARSIARQLAFSRYVCPNCGNAQSHLVARKYVVTHLRRCQSCFLMFRTPTDPPGNEKTMYEHDYVAGFTTSFPSTQQLLSYKKTNF